MKVKFEIGITAKHDNAMNAIGVFSSEKEFEFSEQNPEKAEEDLMNYIRNAKIMNVRLGELLLNFGGPRYIITIRRFE